MSNWYIRIRGKTMGPFPTAEVQQMLATGQVQKYHEISEDKVSWQSIEFVDEFVEEEAAPVRRRKLLRNDDNYESSPAPRGGAKPKKGSSKLGFRILVGSVLTLILAGATVAVILIVRNKDDKVADSKSGDARNGVQELDPETLYQTVVKSVVYIATPPNQKGTYYTGTGSLIDLQKRLVITNYHVVEEEEFVFVMFPKYNADNEIITDKAEYRRTLFSEGIKATVLYREKKRDLALLELDKLPPGDNRALRIQPPDYKVGQGKTAYNVGNAGDVGQMFNISSGTVRSVGQEEIKYDADLTVRCRIITSTNPTNQGDSGGPLVDSTGTIIGVTTGGKVKLGTNAVNWFIDSNEIHAFLRLHGVVLSE